MNSNQALDNNTDASECVLKPPHVCIRRLMISPGHNFVGHHGRAPGAHPMICVPEIECVAGRGVRGDRFFDYPKNDHSQITFFASETMAALRRELNLPDASPQLTRRNVLIEGIDLRTLVGIEFEIQGVRFKGVEECRPCYWMNHAFGHPEAENWLQGRGGLRARIVRGGFLRVNGEDGAMLSADL